jgi:VIT1/CCC1 family predicted Fe2+/Mn2+ transporter
MKMFKRLIESFRVSGKEQRLDILTTELCFRFILGGLLLSVPFYLFFLPLRSTVAGLFVSFLLMVLAEVIGPRRQLVIIGARKRPAVVRKLGAILVWILVPPSLVITAVMFFAVFAGFETNVDFEFVLGLCALSAVSIFLLILSLRQPKNS